MTTDRPRQAFEGHNLERHTLATELITPLVANRPPQDHANFAAKPLAKCTKCRGAETSARTHQPKRPTERLHEVELKTTVPDGY